MKKFPSIYVFILAVAALTLSAAITPVPTMPSDKHSVLLKVTETILTDVPPPIGGRGQIMTTPDGSHTISFKGLGDVVGAIVIDGKVNEVPPGFIRESLAVSPDGKRLAYAVKKDDNKRVVVVDGKEGEFYDAFPTQKPAFSPDSKQVAYIAQIDSGDTRQNPSEQFLVLNGKEGKHYASIWPFVMFSPDSRHVLYFASSNGILDRPGGQFFLVMDGVEGKGYTYRGGSLPQQNLTFSSDGKRFAFTVWDGKQITPVIDGVEGKPYDSILPNSLVFSPDGKRIAFIATRAHTNLAVADGVEGKEFDAPEQRDNGPRIFFSADSKHIAYRAKQGDKYCAVIDGVAGKLYDEVSQAIYFSPDSKHVSYSAKNGKENFNILDDKETKGYYSSGVPTFSPDGKHYAYWARPIMDNTHYNIVVDGVEGKEYTAPAADPVYSPDGKHLAYVALGNMLYEEIIVVDGMEYHAQLLRVMDPRLGIYFKPLQFEGPTRFSYEAMKPNQQFVKVTVDIQETGK